MNSRSEPRTEAAFIDYWRRSVDEDRTGIGAWSDAHVIVVIRRFLAIEAQARAEALEGLDVERLARAIHNATGPVHDDGFHHVDCYTESEYIATEYAALRSPDTEAAERWTCPRCGWEGDYGKEAHKAFIHPDTETAGEAG